MVSTGRSYPRYEKPLVHHARSGVKADVCKADPLRSVFGSPNFRIRPKKRCEAFLIHCSCSQGYHRLGRLFLACGETIAIHFQEENGDNEPGSLVAVQKWMVTNDPAAIDPAHGQDACLPPIPLALP